MRVRDRFTGHTGAVYALVNDDTPGVFLSGSGDGTVVRWNCARPDTGELLVRTDQAIFSLHRDPESSRLLIGGENGDIRVVDLVQRQELQLIRAHRNGIFRMVALPGRRVACAGGDGALSIWSFDGQLSLLRSIPLVEEKLRDLATDRAGDRLAIACGDDTIRILTTDGFNELHTLSGHEGGATAVAWHPNKPALVTGGKDGHVRLWHAGEQFRPLQAVAAHRSTVYRIIFNLDGTQCITTSRDKTAKLWSADSFAPIARLDRQTGGHAMSVNAAIWVDQQVITAGDDRSVLRWTT